MKYFLATLRVVKDGCPLETICTRISARDLVSASSKLKLLTDQYDYWSLTCLTTICNQEFDNLSFIPCL